MALSMYKNGGDPKDCGNIWPDGKGNGALMRVLPLALWHTGTDAELVSDAHKQCLITHGNITNQVCSAFYCLMAKEILNGNHFELSLGNAIKNFAIFIAICRNTLMNFNSDYSLMNLIYGSAGAADMLLTV